MKRLTKRSGISYIPRHQDKDYDAVLNDVELEQAYSQGINKLGLLEDLEEELGCPLDVIFKAIKNGVVLSSKEKKLITVNLVYWIHNQLEFYANANGITYRIMPADYKKTWWLKEDKTE